jgi:enamine deaminase RidA (YjgF/YER057c/UK114 family)
MTSIARRRALALLAAAAPGLALAQEAPADPKARLAGLGVVLPKIAPPLGSYAPFARDGRLLFISGQLPLKDGVLTAKGRVPDQVSVEAAQAAARQCAINILAAADLALDGDLSKIAACLKLTGFIACGADFHDHPKVLNGASDLIMSVLGGPRHARAVVGVASLPLGAPIEVEAVFAISA